MQIKFSKYVVLNACEYYLTQDNEAEDEANVQRIYDTLLRVKTAQSVILDDYEVELLEEWL
jgi:hypothetical protein